MEVSNEQQAPKQATFKRIEVIPTDNTESAPKENPFIRIAKKFGFGKETSSTPPAQEMNSQPINNTFGQDALAGYSASKTPEEIVALQKTRESLEAEASSQNPSSEEPKVSPVVQRMEEGKGIAKVTS